MRNSDSRRFKLLATQDLINMQTSTAFLYAAAMALLAGVAMTMVTPKDVVLMLLQDRRDRCTAAHSVQMLS